MTIEYAALGIGSFLILLILIWKRLRYLDARLGQVCAEITQLQLLESRRLLIALNTKPNGNEANAETKNTPIKSNGVVVANDDHERAPLSLGLDAATSLDEDRALGELTSLVPLVQIERFLVGQEATPAPVVDRNTRSR